MLLRILFFVLGIVIFQDLQAQIKPLTGRITSLENTPIAGASITLRGSGKNTAVAADANGTFTISVPTNKAFRLEITAVGFETFLVSSDSLSGGPLNITLKETPKGLNEVVVVGYGTSRKKDLTGSVTSVPLANNDKAPVFGTGQMLEGTVSGVQVTQTNAQPGASFTVRIRGTNSISYSSDPLYVLDGYAGADLTGLNANDILSIDILKDASAAAIYGSRGANGVVLITTKKGAIGKPAINFDMYTGEQQVSHMLKMMNGKQFATYLNSVATNLNTAKPYTDAQIASMGAGTDWQKAIYRTAPISNY